MLRIYVKYQHGCYNRVINPVAKNTALLALTFGSLAFGDPSIDHEILLRASKHHRTLPQARLPAVSDVVLLCGDARAGDTMMEVSCDEMAADAKACGINAHVVSVKAGEDFHAKFAKAKTALGKLSATTPVFINFHGTVLKSPSDPAAEKKAPPHEMFLGSGKKITTQAFLDEVRTVLKDNPVIQNSCGGGLAVTQEADSAKNHLAMCRANESGYYADCFSANGRSVPRTWPAMRTVLCDREEFKRHSADKKNLSSQEMSFLFRNAGREYWTEDEKIVTDRNAKAAQIQALQAIATEKEKCPDADKNFGPCDETRPANCVKNFTYESTVSISNLIYREAQQLTIFTPPKKGSEISAAVFTKSPGSLEDCKATIEDRRATVEHDGKTISHCQKDEFKTAITYSINCKCVELPATQFKTRTICRTRASHPDKDQKFKGQSDEVPCAHPKFRLTCESC